MPFFFHDKRLITGPSARPPARLPASLSASLSGPWFPGLFLGLFFSLGLMGVSGPAAAQDAKPAELSAQDQRDLQRVETYLNSFTSLKSKFLQVSSNGGFAEGEVSILRPGRLRIEYHPVPPVEIVADDGWLYYHDMELKQVSSVPLSATPAAFLVAKDIKLGGDYTVTGFERGPKSIYVTVTETKDPEEGSVTLAFQDQPLELRKWTTLDAQGIQTTVSLVNPKFNVPLNPEGFKFKYPYEIMPKPQQ